MTPFFFIYVVALIWGTNAFLPLRDFIGKPEDIFGDSPDGRQSETSHFDFTIVKFLIKPIFICEVCNI